ncbi:homeodomain-interacting protein kinase 2-like [Paralichthys olivaceus]|uniref:homeodomain-interacting protein kinase 2-like n=1 Tax=Paralichthys olivaceus TaxID=8255 RepID=UPI00097D7D72|nr:PREDICTED: homeodomain-interacting protein kinase 2-like [Paralichthys olivaceus]
MYRNKIDIHMGDLMSSSTTHYEVQKFLGCGTYGVVIKCRDVTNNEMVALKIPRRIEKSQFMRKEEATLKTMKELNSDWFNIVRLNDSFTYKGHYCLVFEYLEIDLQEFMHSSPGQHLQLKQIRPILQQLATSLDFLKRAGIIHSDLKPENIMLVDPVRQPLKVKIIDFGLACNNPEEYIGQIFQTLRYRSPEILQRAPFNEAIDIWSLGCIVAELSMGRPLFPAWNETDLMRHIMHTKPEHERDVTPYWFWPKYWMESRFMATHNPFWGEDVHAEFWDLECFIDLLTQMLKINQFDRITPGQILQHPFITMSHLRGHFKNSFYLKSCKDLMDFRIRALTTI